MRKRLHEGHSKHYGRRALLFYYPINSFHGTLSIVLSKRARVQNLTNSLHLPSWAPFCYNIIKGRPFWKIIRSAYGDIRKVSKFSLLRELENMGFLFSRSSSLVEGRVGASGSHDPQQTQNVSKTNASNENTSHSYPCIVDREEIADFQKTKKDETHNNDTEQHFDLVTQQRSRYCVITFPCILHKNHGSMLREIMIVNAAAYFHALKQTNKTKFSHIHYDPPRPGKGICTTKVVAALENLRLQSSKQQLVRQMLSVIGDNSISGFCLQFAPEWNAQQADEKRKTSLLLWKSSWRSWHK